MLVSDKLKAKNVL